ncbi:hypothetical protein, partial [Klebsiella aerogenes]|uniref:hypothetical protein n=1 Tax=Klebsiella aerogenes TaxID=548 RepID=UPI001952E4A6
LCLSSIALAMGCVAKALMVSTELTSKSILRGRDKLGLKVLPIGCGTIYKRSALEAVNGWLE